MGLTHEALGNRLRAAREAAGLTQEEAAGALGVSRPTIAQMEAGKHKVTGLELVRLSELYGRPIAELLADEFTQAAEPILFRSLPEVRSDPKVKTAVREATALVREILALRQMLGTHKVDPGLPTYRLPRLTRKWQAAEFGNRLASEERRRLGLGSSPVPNLGALLERQGVLILEMDLPDAVSGLTFPLNGNVVIAVHANQSKLRQRFSMAHEYCHALCDVEVDTTLKGGDARAIVCRPVEEEDLREVRANAFAAAFLLPEDGVLDFVEDLGKGSPSRPSETIYSEGHPGPYVTAEGRLPAHSQELGALEVMKISEFFGASRECTVWRLFNLKLLRESQKDRLLAWARGEASPEGLGEPRSVGGTEGMCSGHAEPLQSARRILVQLAYDALRREEISVGRFRELARRAKLDRLQTETLVEEARMS